MRLFEQLARAWTSLAYSQMRRTFPARALARKPLAFIRQGIFYQFAFAHDLTGPS